MSVQSSTSNLPANHAAGQTPALNPPLQSQELLQGKRFVEIRHNGCTYRLSTTRMGKLILTK